MNGFVTLFAVGVGGGLGALVRYSVGRWLAARGHLPLWGTLIVNVAGSFAAGVVAGVALRSRTPDVYAFAVTGFLGGLTTFSTLSVQKAQLLRERQTGLLAIYIAATYGGGVAGVAAGFALGQAFAHE